MKAILGNFTKISETGFRLKKDLQFADVTIDEDRKIQNVMYQDKQDIEIGDILTHQDIDYEILDINTDHLKYIDVTVKANVQEQDVPIKPTFIARKMTHKARKQIHTPTIVKKQLQVTDVPIEEDPIFNTETFEEINIRVKEENVMHTIIIPKKRNIFKRIVRWFANKLTRYSDS